MRKGCWRVDHLLLAYSLQGVRRLVGRMEFNIGVPLSGALSIARERRLKLCTEAVFRCAQLQTRFQNSKALKNKRYTGL